MGSGTRTVVWTSLARDGLDDVLEYIAEDSPEAAEKVLDVVLIHGARDFDRWLRGL